MNALINRPQGHGLIRLGRLSLLLDIRALWAGSILLALLGAATLFCLVGDGITARQVLATLVGQGDPLQQLLVYQLRLPRLMAGLLSGAALGAAAMSGVGRFRA